MSLRRNYVCVCGGRALGCLETAFNQSVFGTNYKSLVKLDWRWMKGVELKWIHSLEFDFFHFDHCRFLAMRYMDHIHKDVVSSTHIPGGVLLQAAAAWDGSVTCNLLRRLCGCNGGDWISYTLVFFLNWENYPRFFLKKMVLLSCSLFPFCLNSHDLQKTHVTFVDLGQNQHVPVLSSGVFCRCCWQFAPQLIEKSKQPDIFFVTLVCHRLRGPSRSCFTYRVLHPPYLVFLAALVWRLCEDFLPGFPQLDQNFHLEIWINYQWLNPLAWPALLRTYGRHASQLSTSDSFEVASITKMVTATVGLHNFVLTVGKFSRHTGFFSSSYWLMQKKFL